MADRTYEEVLRFLVQASGTAEVTALAKELLSLGDAGSEAEKKTAQLLENLGNAQSLTKTGDAFRDLGAEVVALNKQFNDQKQKVEDLAKAQDAAAEPTKQQTSELAKEREALKEVSAELDKSKARWAELHDALAKAGVATTSYATVQAGITAKQEQAAAALREYAGQLQQANAAEAARTARLNDSDEAFRRQATANRVSAEAMQAYQARAAAASKSTEQLTAAATASTGILSKLRTVAATALGFVSFGTLLGGLKAIVTAGSDAEQELGQLNAVLQSTGNAAGFNAKQLVAMAAELSKTSSFSTGEIVNAQTRLLSYTNIVGKNFPQALQIVIDQSARLGISVEQSAEIVGKALQSPAEAMAALSKQGFVLSDSQKEVLKQLEATGQTAKAQTIIMDLLIESYGGAAAAKKIGTMAGLWKAAKDQVNDFLQAVAERGVLDAFKAQITAFLQTLDKLAKDGSLARWAQQTADAIVKVGSALRDGVGFIVRHRDALLELGKAFAALKIAGWLVQLNALRAAWLTTAREALTLAGAFDTNATKAGRFGAVLKALPTQIKISLLLIGLDAAIPLAKKLGDVLGENSEASRHAQELSRQLTEQTRLEAVQRATLAASLSQYKDQAVLTAQQVGALGDTEREAYKQRLQGLNQYLSAQLGYLLRQQQIGLATQEQLDQLAKLPGQLAAVRAGYRALEEGATLAATAMTAQLSPAAQLVVDKLQGIDSDAKLATESIKKLFDGLNFSDSNGLGDVALALAQISSQGVEADRNVRDGLMATLRQLTGEELLKFQSGAAAAFDEFKKGPAETATILNATLVAAMERLNVSATRMGVAFTDAGKDATAAFSTILENANSTSAQIEVAFKAALSKVSTLDEARTLGTLLQSAGLQGKVGFDAAERSAAALRSRLGEIQAALSPLADEFAQLGIKSQAELNNTRDAAKAAFDAIQAGVGKGTASIEDSRRAFVAYATAARAAVADSDTLAKSRVENELAVKAALVDTTGQLHLMGDVGSKAGDSVTTGARQATVALTEAADAAGDASANVESFGIHAEAAGRQAARSSEQYHEASFGLIAMSDAARDALLSLNHLAGQQDIWRNQFNATVAEIKGQKDQVAQLTSELDKQMEQFDPLAQKLAELRVQYKFVDDATLRAYAEKAQQLEDRQKQAEEAATRANEQALRATQQAAPAAAPAGPSLPTGPATATAQAPSQATRVGTSGVLATLRVQVIDGKTVDLLVDEASARDFITELSRSRSVSQRKR